MKKDSIELEIVTIGEDGIKEEDILIHDEKNRMLATLLASMQPPDFPIALGVLYCDPTPTYDGAVHDQIKTIKESNGRGDFDKLLHRGHTWEV